MVNIHFGGSRALTQNHFSQVSQVVNATLATGAGIHVGCAVGADQFIIQAVQPALAASHFRSILPLAQVHFQVLLWPVSSLLSSRHPVSYLAGGPLSVPLRARLLRRSIAALRGSSSAVFFLSQSRLSRFI